jgi:hypothetical protein
MLLDRAAASNVAPHYVLHQVHLRGTRTYCTYTKDVVSVKYHVIVLETETHCLCTHFAYAGETVEVNNDAVLVNGTFSVEPCSSSPT